MMMVTWFVAISSLVLLVYLLISGRSSRIASRLEDVSSMGARSPHQAADGTFAPPRVSSTLERAVARQMKKEQRKERTKDRLVQAGLYKRRSNSIFWFFRLLLVIVPVAFGVAASRFGLLSLTYGILGGVLLGLVGTMMPSFWLDHLKRGRQTKIRRSLPDALDVMVICLEGGLSLSSALSRVAREMASAHRMLAVELKIVERQIQMGRTTGQAIRQFAQRFDLEELRSLASVIIQAERFGSGVVKAITVYADTLRLRRQQRAEEMAHKAGVKLLFPTVLFIFPGMFVVLLGPAAMIIYEELIRSGAMGG